ncbi:MAG TPA: hypothetical protein VNU24_02280, partial [Solirubrobacteraceae bacterium]|nr:hypothetical protein [Solirubrobacteraceae bacterium]
MPGSPLESEELGAQERASLSNPEAVVAREVSQTKYENLSTEEAEKVDGEAFGSVFDEVAGGPPPLEAGQSITGYPADNVAQVDLGEGKRGLIEST